MRKEIPALWQGDQEEYYIYNQDLNDGVFALKRWGAEDPNDEVLIVANMSDKAHTNKVWIPLGKVGDKVHKAKVEWEEIFNTDDVAFNGPNAHNHERGYGRINRDKTLVSEQTGINLAPWSIAVFRKKKANHHSRNFKLASGLLQKSV